VRQAGAPRRLGAGALMDAQPPRTTLVIDSTDVTDESWLGRPG
jgi:hypothetical protein